MRTRTVFFEDRNQPYLADISRTPEGRIILELPFALLNPLIYLNGYLEEQSGYKVTTNKNRCLVEFKTYIHDDDIILIVSR